MIPTSVRRAAPWRRSALAGLLHALPRKPVVRERRRYPGVLAGVAWAMIGSLAPAASYADDARYAGRSLALEAQAGTGMPLGYYGLALDSSISPHVVIAAGAGFAYEAGYGTTKQFMVASRLRYPLAKGWANGWAMSAGAGVSVGDYIQTTVTAADGQPSGNLVLSEQRWITAVRLNAEVSVEYRFATPLSARVFGGLGRLLNDPQCVYIADNIVSQGACAEPVIPRRFLDYDRTRTFFGIALGYQLAASTSARRGPGPMPPASTVPDSSSGEIGRWQRWYGWQTLLADAAGYGIALAAYRQTPRTEWAIASKGAGVTIYFAGAPSVHLANRHPYRSVLSVGARVLLPLAGALLYWAAVTEPRECTDFECPVLKGLYVGAAAASLTDAALLSW